MKMKPAFTMFALLGSLLLLPAAFAMDKAGPDYKGVMKTIPHVTIAFPEGSAALSQSDRTKLHDLVMDASENGKIAKISVAAWSDKAFPAEGQLSEADRDLADMRAENIRKVIKETLKTADVATYSMAEDTNWLARTLKTDDSELKSVFSKKGAKAPVTHAEFTVIKNEGGPSSAVTVVEY